MGIASEVSKVERAAAGDNQYSSYFHIISFYFFIITRGETKAREYLWLSPSLSNASNFREMRQTFLSVLGYK